MKIIIKILNMYDMQLDLLPTSSLHLVSGSLFVQGLKRNGSGFSWIHIKKLTTIYFLYTRSEFASCFYQYRP